jgi:hypothetical protein
MTLLEDFVKALVQLKLSLQQWNYRPETSLKITLSPDIMLKLLAETDPLHSLDMSLSNTNY